MSKEDKKEFPLFSNGTEFMWWSARNCEQCTKAVFYNEKKDYYPKYRCAIQKHIDEACVGDGRGNKRDYMATSSHDCPYKKTQRKRTHKKKRQDENQLSLF